MDKDDEVDKDNEVDKDDKVDKDDMVNKNDEDNKEKDMDKKEDEKRNFFFKILNMTKPTDLPNLVWLAQWEQVSEYIHKYILLLPVILKRGQT